MVQNCDLGLENFFFLNKNNAPVNKVLDVVVFEGPDVLAVFGGISVFSVAE